VDVAAQKQRLLLAARPPRAEHLDLVRRAERAFSAPLTPLVRVRVAAALREGHDAFEVIEHVATHPLRAAHLAQLLGAEGTADETFVTATFSELLGRTPEEEGLANAVGRLRSGVSRPDYVLEVISSIETRNRERPTIASLAHLPDLVAMSPHRYELARSTGNKTGSPVLALRVRGADDVDWIERMILEHGYYEVPNAWHLEVDTDKQVLGQIIAAFRPERSLELGCSSGAVLSVLDDLGVAAEGIDISASSADRAAPAVRPRIHHGDLLTFDLKPGYDVFCGFDIFEHLNPRHLGRYLDRIRGLLRPGGFVVTNIPAYGDDPVFGTAFPPELVGWQEQDGTYDLWPVDACGFPHLGHLVWATARWWVERFSDAGFTRLPEVEQAIHGRYGDWMRASAPARRSFFVFAVEPDPDEVAAVVGRVPEVTALAGV
jgi:2-polyprenyl-3-methyl-5-hydroxy-6-metoxy-1,4-benzoquinol methylase